MFDEKKDGSNRKVVGRWSVVAKSVNFRNPHTVDDTALLIRYMTQDCSRESVHFCCCVILLYLGTYITFLFCFLLFTTFLEYLKNTICIIRFLLHSFFIFLHVMLGVNRPYCSVGQKSQPQQTTASVHRGGVNTCRGVYRADRCDFHQL